MENSSNADSPVHMRPTATSRKKPRMISPTLEFQTATAGLPSHPEHQLQPTDPSLPLQPYSKSLSAVLDIPGINNQKQWNSSPPPIGSSHSHELEISRFVTDVDEYGPVTQGSSSYLAMPHTGGDNPGTMWNAQLGEFYDEYSYLDDILTGQDPAGQDVANNTSMPIGDYQGLEDGIEQNRE